MWRSLAAVALGVAGALYVNAHRTATPFADAPGWSHLPNGLRFAVERVAGAKDVAVLVSFAIGAEHDPEGRVGLAHLTEHLYVTSAAGATGARTVDDIEKEHPGRWTAFTLAAETHFFTIVGADTMDAELADAAARMSDLRIEQSDLDRERPRVLEQIDGAATPTSHGMRVTQQRLGLPPAVTERGGVPADVERMSLADVRAWAERYYKPVNARLVVAGDVDATRVTALVEKLFAPVQRGEAAPPSQATRPATPGVFEVPPAPDVAAAPNRTRDIWMASPPATAGAREFAALSVIDLRSVLGLRSPSSKLIFPFDSTGGRTGRAVTSWNSKLSVEEFVREADAMVAGLSKEPPSASEIDEFRSAVGRTVPPADTGPVAEGGLSGDQGLTIATYRLLTAGEDRLDRDADRLFDTMSSLTKADLDRAAAKWFGPEGRVIVTTWNVPKPAPPRPKIESKLPDGELIGGFRVVLTWDDETRTLRRKIGDAEYEMDDDLEKAIRREHDVWVKKRKPDAPVTIVCDATVPWDSVMAVVDVVKRCGIEHIEFDMHAPPATPK